MNGNQLYTMVLVFLLAMTAAVWSATSKAADGTEDSIIVGGLSYHLETREYTENYTPRPINEVNEAIGYRHGDSEIAVGIVFKNSYYRESYYAIYNPRWEVNDDVYVGLRLGAATGYENTPIDLQVAPVVGAELSYDLGPVTFNVGFIAPEVITFHLELDL